MYTHKTMYTQYQNFDTFDKLHIFDIKKHINMLNRFIYQS